MAVRILEPLYREKTRYRDLKYRDTKTEAARKFYSSTAWRKKSEQHRRDELLCRPCSKQGRVTLATLTDHIVPIEQGGDPWDDDNLQSSCDPCHNAKRQAERGRGRAVQITRDCSSATAERIYTRDCEMKFQNSNLGARNGWSKTQTYKPAPDRGNV